MIRKQVLQNMEPYQQPTDSDSDYTPPHGVPGFPPPAPLKRSKRWLLVFPAAVLIIALGFAAWKQFGTKSPAPQAINSTETNSGSNNTETTENDVPDATSTKEYSNGFLGLKLTQPDTWTTTEAENGVRIESPSFTYAAQDKGEVSGYFRIYIRKGARTVDGKYIGRGYAIQPSEKLTYANPAPGQRAETNLTLFGLDEPTNFAFFMIAGNYSLQKGDTLGPNYGKEAETYIIAGGFSEKALTDDLATNPVDPELLKTSNAYKQALEILKSLSLR